MCATGDAAGLLTISRWFESQRAGMDMIVFFGGGGGREWVGSEGPEMTK